MTQLLYYQNNWLKKRLRQHRGAKGRKDNKTKKTLVKIIPNPQEIKNAAVKAFSRVKNGILELNDSVKKPLKGYVEGEARKENQEEEEEEEEEGVDLTPYKHERALKGARRNFYT